MPTATPPPTATAPPRRWGGKRPQRAASCPRGTATSPSSSAEGKPKGWGGRVTPMPAAAAATTATAAARQCGEGQQRGARPWRGRARWRGGVVARWWRVGSGSPPPRQWNKARLWGARGWPGAAASGQIAEHCSQIAADGGTFNIMDWAGTQMRQPEEVK